VARPDKQTGKQTDPQSDPEIAAPGGQNDDATGDDADGYKPTRRQLARGGGEPRAAKPNGKPAPEKGPPPSKYRQFMDQHWESWLSQVLLILVLGFGFIGYKLEYLREGMVGLVLVGGILALAIYGTAGPAYDLIENKGARMMFAALAFDITVSGSIRPEAGGERKVDYTLSVTGENNQSSELSGQFEVRVNQMRTRRGSSHWTQQHNQVEHRLPSSLRGNELTIAAESIDEALQSGLHVAVHPQSLNPLWFLITGIFVVLAMFFVEARVGDSKTKTHLIMASASTLVFAWHFADQATANRLVPPALDSLFLALVTGGIGGTLVGAVVRRVSGRDKVKPRNADDAADDKTKE
jgi:hypothetical protein